MPEHRVGTQEEWQAERQARLATEGVVYRTYVTTARGLEPVMSYYGLLDRTAMGRNETGSQPHWLRRHDEY